MENNIKKEEKKDISVNWEEDYIYENGTYQNICIKCQVNFFGHKYRRVCKACFIPFKLNPSV